MDDRTTVIDGVLVELKHEHQIRDIIPSLHETKVETPTVDRLLGNFEKQWITTAEDCTKRAEELEAAAADLRQRAMNLHSALDYLQDVKSAVVFEIESRNRAMSLALVNPKDHD